MTKDQERAAWLLVIVIASLVAIVACLTAGPVTP